MLSTFPHAFDSSIHALHGRNQKKEIDFAEDKSEYTNPGKETSEFRTPCPFLEICTNDEIFACAQILNCIFVQIQARCTNALSTLEKSMRRDS